MKNSILAIVGALLIWQCTLLNSNTTASESLQPLELMDCSEQQQLEEWVRANPDIYYGEGFGTIKNNEIGEAKVAAKNSAIADLAANIQVTIRGDLETTVFGRTIGEKTSYEETIRQRIETYTENVLEEIQESKPFVDCPRKNNLAYYVWLEKEKYQERVQNDLKTKKAILERTANEGLIRWRNHDYVNAVKNLSEAQFQLNNFFGGLPVITKISTTGESINLTGKILEHLEDFYQNLRIELLNQNFVYDAQGKVNEQPIIYAYYQDREGKKYPLPGLPLVAVFIEGGGEMTERFITREPRGDVELAITDIRPDTRTTNILVQLDDAGFPTSVPEHTDKLRISLKRKPIVALALFPDANASSRQNDRLLGVLSKALLTMGLDVVTVIPGQAGDNLPEATRNADFLLKVQYTFSKPMQVPPLTNMYEVVAVADLDLTTVPGNTLLKKENITGIKGYGSSAANANGDAFGKIITETPKLVKTFADKLR